MKIKRRPIFFFLFYMSCEPKVLLCVGRCGGVLGPNLTPNLKQLIECDKFSSRIVVQFELNWRSFADSITIPEDFSCLAIQHKKSPVPGVSNLQISTATILQHVDLYQHIEPPVNINLYLRRVLDDLPSNPIPYYVGPLPKSVLDSLFPSDDLISQLQEDSAHVPGLTTLYGHLGKAGSGMAFHCEDAQVRSYNLTVSGYELWILIRKYHTSKFELLVRKLAKPATECDQFVRHACLLITPERL